MSKRVKLVVAYEGTGYHGWQIQPNGITIEEVLNRELSALLKEPVEVIGASRTDAGVHALGNVAVFDTESRIPAEKIMYALNQRLPEDIRIQNSEETAPDFHPRHCDSRKTYEYLILNHPVPVPQYRNFTHFYYYPLDVERMRRATAYLEGEHNFESFCSVKTQVKEFTRTIYSLDVGREGKLVRIRVSGSGFLYNMVRILAGTLLEVGSGKREPEQMEDILKARCREAAGPTAPARGLTLIGIEYGENVENLS